MKPIYNTTGYYQCNHTINKVLSLFETGSKQRNAPFTDGTAKLLSEVISHNGSGQNIWGITRKTIQDMLFELKAKTNLPCNPHIFRRTFASNLYRKGMDIEHIMRLGGWESLDMVLRYTRSVKFEDSLKLYREMIC